MGLPYILGDANPKDPTAGWDKTWAFLKELGQYVDYYPSGTTETMKNLANGTAHLIVSTTGWDINPRVLGTVPKEAGSPRSTASTGSPTRTTPCCPRACRPTRRPRCWPCWRSCSRPNSRRRRTTRATSTRARRSGCAALVGAAEEPGRDSGVRPLRVRRADQRESDRGPARREEPGGGVQPLGPRDRRREGQAGMSAFTQLRLDGVSRRFGARPRSPSWT
ncbi:hypothetical protein NKG94_15170 [Micromonospora sp. M12]